MAKAHPIAAKAEALCGQTIKELGFDLLETVFVKENGDWFLRFYIDKRGGISMDDCVTVTQAVDPLIDAELEVPNAYHLEISSPGLDRPLKTEADFRRHLDEWIDVSLYKARDKSKRFTGVLTDYREDGTLVLTDEKGVEHEFTAAERAVVKRAIRF